MSVTPADLLFKAKCLATSDTEIDRRLAINRAYYAAYHMARAVAPLCPPSRPVTRKGGSHWELLQCFEVAKGKVFPGSKQAMEIFNLLRQSRDLRHDADYDLSSTLLAGDVRFAIDNAERIQALIAVFIRRQPT